MGVAKAKMKDIKMAKIVGENDDGITLFVGKDENGVFHLEEGDMFLSIMFVRQVGTGVVVWTPWEAD